MPKPKDHDRDDKHEQKHEHEHDHEHEHEDEHEYHHGPHRGGYHQRPPEGEGGESGDDPKRHASVIERRWIGSAPPTPERYARALEQWQKLPGAVSRPATDVTGADDKHRAPKAGPVNPNPAEEES